MKMLRKLHLPTLVAAVAAAGLSLSAAYAVPSYSPDPLSPTNAADGGANLGNGVNLINAVLPPGFTVVLPAANATGGESVLPDSVRLLAAIQAAAVAASGSDKADVLRAALYIAGNDLYKPLKPNTTTPEFTNTTGATLALPLPGVIVRAVLKDYIQGGTYVPTDAIALVEAALTVNNGKDLDVLTNAILAVGDVGIGGSVALAREQDADEIAAAALNKSNSFAINTTGALQATLITGIAKAAITSVKPGATPAVPKPPAQPIVGVPGFDNSTGNVQARVNDIAVAVVNAIEGSNFLLDDAIKGLVQGAITLKLPAAGGVTLSGVASAISGAVPSDTVSQAHAFTGVLLGLGKPTATNAGDFESAKNAFGGSANATITAVSTAYQGVANLAVNPANTLVALVTAAPENAEYLTIGAAAANAAHVKTNLEAAMKAPLVTNDGRIAMLAGASRVTNANAAAYAASAIGAGVTSDTALQTALSNTTAAFAGAVFTEVAKKNPTPTAAQLLANPSAPQPPIAALIQASIGALEELTPTGAEDDAKAGIIDIIGAASLFYKLPAQHIAIINAGIGALPANSDYAEVIAAAIGRQANLVNNDATFTAALAGSSPEKLASVLAAGSMARYAKTSPLLALAEAQKRLRDQSASNAAAIMLGAGSVNKLHVNVLLASALRKGNGVFDTSQKAQLLAHAKSLNKALESETQLTFDVATKVLETPDELFDIVDHESIKTPKLVNIVAGAAAAAAPQYAHYVARAAASRSSVLEIAQVPLAIFEGADMNASIADNPAATSAIAAAFVLGMKDQKQHSVVQEKTYIAGMTALVKAAMTFGNKGQLATAAIAAKKATATTPAILAVPAFPIRGTFRGVNLATGAAPTAADQYEYGSAAAVTGATSILSNEGDLLPSTALLAVLKGAGAAVGKATGSQMTVIAQAAMQAFIWVTKISDLTNEARDAIVNAIATGAKLIPITDEAKRVAIQLAADNGKAEAVALNYGAGAAGVLNYAHVNSNNSPVTDISGF